jgi:hypothetical protein
MSTNTRNAILRYATGIGISASLAFVLAWPLAFVAPMLTASILANKKPAPGVNGVLVILLAIATIFSVGLILSGYIYNYTAVFILFFSWALFRVFMASARGQSGFVVLLYLMALMMLPLLGAGSTETATVVATGFLMSALTALLVVVVADWFFPVHAEIEAIATVSPPINEVISSAWLSLAVVLPIALICLTFNLTSALLPLLMIATLAQKPDFSTGAAGSKALIAANLAGGLVALVFYQLLQANPSLPFLLLGLVALALMFARKIFSDDPMAPLWASAFSTVLVLIGSGTGAFGGEADSKFYERIFQLTLAVCYIVGALSLLHGHLIRERWLSVGRRVYGKLATTSGEKQYG